jgi:hypothetical protein
VHLQLAVAKNARRVTCLKSLEVDLDVALDDIHIAAMAGLEAVEQRSSGRIDPRDAHARFVDRLQSITRPTL